MEKLPVEFIEYTRRLMGDERFERYLHSFEEDIPVSIRLNPKKSGEWKVESGERVDWCRNGYYLMQRPNFTFDPLFHAGCYYVQEAASMFLDEVLRQAEANFSLFTLHSSLHYTAEPTLLCNSALDMCAAPGGKSTLLRAALPEDCVLYSNEPIRNRASILLENVTKWGYDNHIVTNAYPRDYRKAKLRFDVILCDVPCSGEGMFRKDEATIREWSPQNVEKCWQLQREIVSDAWQCLNPGGILIYSTCTFNTKENEENIRWMLSEFDDAEVVPVETKPEWHITGSLLPGFTEPVYRFIPGITRSEGLFLCVLKKRGKRNVESGKRNVECGKRKVERGKRKVECGKWKEKRDLSAAEQFSFHYPPSTFHFPLSSFNTALSYQQAINYLRGEAIVLPPDTPRGVVTVTFMGHPLGQVKNIGPRANNLYPKPWRIKTTHIPNEYEPILKQI